MEVSKSHAIVYHTVDDAVEAEAAAYVDRDAWGGGGEEVEGRAWDKGKGTGGKWWIVDSGSMHGTYLKKRKEREKVEDGGGGLGYDGEVGTKSKGGGKKEKGQRLSESKTASLPARLEHGDLLSVGSTIFEVHLHPNFPCTQCSSTTTSSLIPTSFAPDSSSQLSDASSSWKSILDREHGPQLPPLNPREKLKRLKEELLSKDSTKRTESHSSSSTSNEEEGERRKEREYQDRAALRREIYPDEPLPPPITSYSKKRKPNPTSLSAPPKPSAAQTSYSALPSTNVGHAMLLKKGWNPGSALGLAGEAGGGRTEPLQVKRLAGEGRKGLGVKSVEVNGEEEGEWRERGKSKRWKEEMGLL
ncbi:hypothetical protein BDY24DRAFT_385926 [Mrakia frigida]|uniref:uncharacterized protein n=1 Tax=Mrakia frigida TaxID=29902 RepID=UPI003FCC0EE2